MPELEKICMVGDPAQAPHSSAHGFFPGIQKFATAEAGASAQDGGPAPQLSPNP
jgi:hypothetical protein